MVELLKYVKYSVYKIDIRLRFSKAKFDLVFIILMAQHIIDILDLNETGVISLIGGGGKTSLMFHLARILARTGKKVLTTTTTKIFIPDQDQSPRLIIGDSLDIFTGESKIILSFFNHFSAGQAKTETKVMGFNPGFIDDIHHTGIFDWIIVEADGSKQKPTKSSDTHEPVIPKTTNRLLVVAGLDAVGKPLNENFIHRPRIFSKHTGLSINDPVTEDAISTALGIEIQKAEAMCLSTQTYLLLNKADNSNMELSGNTIARQMPPNLNINKTLTLSCKDELTIKGIYHGNQSIP